VGQYLASRASFGPRRFDSSEFRGLRGQRTIGIRNHKVPKPEITLGKFTVKCRRAVRVNRRTCGSGFIRDSRRESNEPLRLMNRLNNPVSGRAQGGGRPAPHHGVLSNTFLNLFVPSSSICIVRIFSRRFV
jgi:hypothetical protein